MNPDRLREILAELSRGETSIDRVMQQLKSLPFESIGDAMVDHHRALRCGAPEVIFCQGKTVEQVIMIAKRLHEKCDRVLATRASVEQLAAIQVNFIDCTISEIGRVALIGKAPTELSEGNYVALICAGTADLPVAEEAAMTLRSMNVPTKRLTDVGVSGLHRLLSHVQVLQGASACIVIAGMEGALPSVVGGLVDCPVFAVPTSVGYGANFGGLSALLGMLNSCASNVSVVNIDNGFGAAYCAAASWRQIRPK